MIATEFRRAFAAGLTSGKDQRVINGVVRRIETVEQVMACLDVYCDLVDAKKPPEDTARLEIAKSTGHGLFMRAATLPDATNTAAEMVRQMARLEAGEAPPPAMPAKYAVYFPRWTMIPAAERRLIDEQARITLRERASVKADKKLLITTLAEDYLKTRRQPHKSVDDLIAFSPADDKQRTAFTKLAAACDTAWTAGSRARTADSKKGPKLDALVDATWDAFDAFGKYVEHELNSPSDFFRLLALAREASGVMARFKVVGTQYHVVPPPPWGNVWDELYFEVAWRGQNLAATKWGYRRMWQSRTFVADDLEFVMRPFGDHGRRLLEGRLKHAWYAEESIALHRARRRAYLVGKFKGIELLDEVQTVEQSRVMKAGWEADPVAIAKRSTHYSGRSVQNVKVQTYWNLQTFNDAFTVLWIEKEGLNGTALIEVEGMPGFVFRASAGQMSDLNAEAFFRALARNAAALTVFLLAYLEVLGLAFDIITAGISGGLRHFVFHFAQERLLDKLGDVALDAADIQNPGIRLLVSFGVNLVPKPNLGGIRVRSDAEIDAEAAVAAARKIDAPKTGRDLRPPKPEIPKDRPDVHARTSGGGDLDVPALKLPAVKLTEALKAEIDALYPPLPSAGITEVIVENLDRAVRWVDEKALGPVRGLFDETPVAAGAGTRGTVHEPMLRVGGKPAPQGLGTGGRSAPKSLRDVDKLRKSAVYQLLEEYEPYLEAGAKLEMQRVRGEILARFRTGKIDARRVQQLLENQVRVVKGQTGEYVGAAGANSYFDVKSIVSIPNRSTDVPILDQVFELRRGPNNKNWDFFLNECKGGEDAALSVTRAWSFEFEGATLVRRRRGGRVTQGSGEWYYYRLCEIYRKPGKGNQTLARKLFTAIEEGRAVFGVTRSGKDLVPDLDLSMTKEVTDWFKKQKWNKWDKTKGFPTLKNQ